MTVTPLAAEERSTLRLLLDGRRPAEAMPSYYAFHHPAAKTRIWVHRSGEGRPDGLAVRAQTGMDLFRPFVVIRAARAADARALLAAALPEGQPAILSLPAESDAWALPLLPAEPPVALALLRLAPARFQPVINIFVRTERSPDGLPRAEIRQADQVVAAAGVNWMSPEAAEIFVQTDPAYRERGFGKSAAAALCAALLEERRMVMYAVEERNPRSRALAEALGFEDTGARERLLRGARADSSATGTHVEARA